MHITPSQVGAVGAVVMILGAVTPSASVAASGHRSATRHAQGSAGRVSTRRAAAGARPDFDSRLRSKVARAASVPAQVVRARSSLRQALGATAVVSTDPVTGGVAALARIDGYLTAPSTDDAADVALGYVRSHLAAFGLTAADVDGLELAHRTTSSDGVTHVSWVAKVGGITVFDRDLRAAVDGQGRLLNLQGAPEHAASVAGAEPALSPRDAVASAQKASGIAVDVPSALAAPKGATLKTSFPGGDQAMLVVFPTAAGDRLAYRVLTTNPATGTLYGSVVDAADGRLLYRVSLTADANNASVFDLYPGAAGAGGVQHTVDLSPWLDAPATTKVLAGNNAHVWEDVNDNGVADAGEEAEPSNPGQTPAQWSYGLKTYTPAQLQAKQLPPAYALCPSAGCTWNAAVDTNDPQSWTANSNENAAQVFYFVNKFHDYAAQPPISFTPATRSFEGTDRLNGQALSGAINNGGGSIDQGHIDNANMSTPPDGQSPTMRMYLFAATNPPADAWTMVNGGDDATIVMHEYTHGISGRTVIDSTGMTALGDAQGGALNEAWSDFFSLDYLYASGLLTDGPSVDVQEGPYETLQPTGKGPRTQPVDCPVNGGGAACPGPGGTPGARAGAGGYTYGDFAQIAGADVPEVHNDGEIWAETLWDLRQALGHDRAVAIVAGGQKMTPANPTFLTARDAILQSALTVGGLDLQYQAAKVFAARGMGAGARAINPADIHPTQDFTAPPSPVYCPTGQVLPPGAACPVPVVAPAPAPAPAPAVAPVKVKPKAVILLTKKLRYARSKFTVTIKCPSTEVACTGSIRLTLGAKALKASSFALKRGKSRAVSLKVTKAALRKAAAKRAKKAKVTLTVIDNDTKGVAHTTRATLSVKLR